MPRRSTGSFTPICAALETRLAPSGNFISHGLADVTREVKHLEHQHSTDHSMGVRHETQAGDLKVHYDHMVTNPSK